MRRNRPFRRGFRGKHHKNCKKRRQGNAPLIADDKSGEEISVSVFYDRADKGDYIEVKYLKHSKSYRSSFSCYNLDNSRIQ
jgi:hypothetical protein